MTDYDTKDVSPSAIKRAVLSTAAQKPLTVYPAVAGLLGGVSAMVLSANVWSLSALAVGGVCAAASWGWEYWVRGNDHANQYISQYREALAKTRNAALVTLRRDLEELDYADGIKQIDLFRKKYDNLVAVLHRKLDETELTYHRYLSIAEQVFLGGIDHLEQAALVKRSVSAIDPKLIEERLAATQQSGKRDELKKRLVLRSDQLKQAEQLLLLNEQALTQLDQVTAKLAAIDTKNSHAELDLEVAMAELQHLVKQTEEPIS